MNRTVGKIGALVTGAAVLAFAASMIFGLFLGGDFSSCLSSMFIAIGFIPFICAVAAISEKPEHKAVSFAAVAFAAVYAVIIFLVYYAEITTVRMSGSLSGEALSIISYGRTGSLFFNYDLLGYAMMALSTFLIGFAVQPKSKGDHALRWLLWIHGVFFLSCLLIPLFPVFTAGSSPVFGVVILEVWCAYFLPVCVLGYRYFREK